MVRVIYKPPVNHSHKGPAERGEKNMTLSSLPAGVPDKHVDALGSFISNPNKDCFRCG